MNLLQLDRLKIKRLKLMLVILFPEFGFFKVKKHGMVVMKKHWYSFKRVLIPATDLCISEIPIRLKELKRKLPQSYAYKANYLSADELIIIGRHGELVNYLYKEFSKLNLSTYYTPANSKLPIRRPESLPNRVYDPHGAMRHIISTIKGSKIYVKLSDNVILSYTPHPKYFFQF